MIIKNDNSKEIELQTENYSGYDEEDEYGYDNDFDDKEYLHEIKKIEKSKRFKKYFKATKILQRVNKKYALKLTDDEIKFIVDSAYYESENR